eukprot:79950-Rhodomonas_salina.2
MCIRDSAPSLCGSERESAREPEESAGKQERGRRSGGERDLGRRERRIKASKGCDVWKRKRRGERNRHGRLAEGMREGGGLDEGIDGGCTAALRCSLPRRGFAVAPETDANAQALL